MNGKGSAPRNCFSKQYLTNYESIFGKRKKDTMIPKPAQNLFFNLLTHFSIKHPVAEYKFHATRKWRFDYAWVDQKLALEVEGGIWTRGRHIRSTGYIADMEKYNTASSDGWKVIRVEPSKLSTFETIKILKKCLTLKD